MNRLGLIVFVVFALPPVVLAQSGSIRGVVSSAEARQPLEGANVFVVELSIGAATSANGAYAIENVPVGTYTVRTSFVGFRTVERPLTVVAAGTSYDVSLEVDYARQDEVLVTGIASRRSRATSDVAVGRIDAVEPLRNNAYQDVTQLINGRVSGVTIQPASGNVATGMRFIMRTATGMGDGQPIVFVDGVRFHHFEEKGLSAGAKGGQGVSQLAHLNPDDIEKIDILKGPAGSALYGTSAANGVVLITTKTGSFGSGLRTGALPFGLTYEGTSGSNNLARKYDAFNSSTPDATNASFRSGSIWEHLLTASGGSQSVRFYASFGNRSENGHLLGSWQERRSFRANFEAFPASRLRVSAKTAFVRNEVARPPNDWDANGWLHNNSILQAPYLLADSIAIANLTNVQKVNRFTGSIEMEYVPVEKLTVAGVVGYDGTDLLNDRIRPAGFRYREGTEGARSILDKENRLLTFNMNARYGYSVTPWLQGTTTVGTQGTDSRSRYNQIDASGFPDDLIVAIGAASEVIASDGSINVREMGVYGMQDFALEDRVLLTVGLRRDYASAIGYEAPSILYPRASVAVRVDNLIDLPAQLPFLKVRAAYGEAGRLPGPLDGQPLTWAVVNSGYGPAASPVWGNPEIKPERTKEFETGVELGLFGNRLSLESTYYRQHATDNLVDRPWLPSSGVWQLIPYNLGSANGWGLETMVSAIPVQSSSTSIELTLIWNWMDNEITSLGGTAPIYSYANVNVYKVGLPKEAYYNWRSVPTFNEDGSYNEEPTLASTDDADGDGLPDREFLGTPYPEQSGSFQFSLRFLRDFHVTGLADWQLGLESYDASRWFRVMRGTDTRVNIARVQLGLVEDPCEVRLCDESGNLKPEFEGMNVTPQEVGSDLYLAAADIVGGSAIEVEVGADEMTIETKGNWVENASFFTLREMALRYDFRSLLARMGLGQAIRSLSLTIAGRNLFLVTPFGGADPEASTFGAETYGENLARGSGFTLPNPRVIYAKLTVGI